MRKKFFSYVAGSAACAALILLSGCQQTTDQLSNITHYVGESGRILPNRLWNIGRTENRKLFLQESRRYNTDFVVEVLIDGSGSQRSRQSHPLKSSLWTVMYIRRFRRKYALCTTRFMMQFSMKKKMWR